MKNKCLASTLALVLSLFCQPAMADPTAFELAKSGNEFLGVQSKDKVVEIRSEKSVGTLVPNIWYVVYYDPDASLKAVEVKFGAGKKLDVSHPARILEMATDEHKIFAKDQLKIDSDRALSIAKAQPLLDHLTLTATQMRLEHGDLGPQWRVKIWAQKLKHPENDADIGVVIISATDGTINKIDLHPDSVD